MRWTPSKPIKVTPPSPSETLWRAIQEDVIAVKRNDPAARNVWEILTSYPGLHALWLHRLSHGLWNQGMVTTARMLSNFNRALTGVEIHPGAVLGRRVFIDHGMGVVIGETAIVGDECLIYKGVVLGGTTLDRAKRHPTLGKGVVVGSNVCILGRVTIGDGAKIGSGSVVVKDVPEGATAVGVPGRIVATMENQRPLDHGDLPDPMATLVRSLLEQLETLGSRVEALEARGAYARHEGVVREVEGDAESERRRVSEALTALFYEGD